MKESDMVALAMPELKVYWREVGTLCQDSRQRESGLGGRFK